MSTVRTEVDMAYLNDRLQLTASGLVWVKGKWTEGKEAGDAKGRVSLEGEKYTKESVIAALSAQDMALLVNTKAQPSKAKAKKEDPAKALRRLITTVTNRDDLLAVYRTIELLEAVA